MVEEKTGRLVQLATAGVIAWDLAEIGRFFYIALLESPLHTIPWLAGALVIYLPLQLVLVRGAIRGERPRGSWWLLAGVALTLAVALPFGGLFMVLALWVPAALALLYFKPPWSLVLLAVVAAIAFIAALSGSLRSWEAIVTGPLTPTKLQVAAFDTMDVVWGGVAFAVLAWLVRTVTELNDARQQLAARAVVAERRRIDDEVDRTVGAALEHIIAAGEQAVELAGVRDRAAAERELVRLTGLSRATLADSRGLLTGYRQTSAEAELRAAITLLTAGGVQVNLELPDAGLPSELPDGLRAKLRALIADALRDQCAASECTLTVAAADGTLDVSFRRVAAALGREGAA